MFNVSQEYRTASANTSRETKVEGTITLEDESVIEFDSSNILAGSLSIDNAAVNGQELNLGSVYTGRMQASIKLNIDRYKLYGTEIRLTYFLKTQSGWEAVPIGVYQISEVQRNGDYFSILAYDAMLKFDKSVSYNTTTTGKPYTLIEKCCTTCGVDFEQTEEEIDALSPTEIVEEEESIIRYGLPTDQSINTYRDLLSDIAVILGGFFVIGRYGQLRFQQFGTDSGITITNQIRKSAEIYDYKCIYSGVSAILDKELYLAGTEDNIVLTLGEVNLLKNGLLITKQTTIDHIYEQIGGLEYTPGTLTWMGDPALDLGDMIKVIGYDTDVNGNYLCVTSFSWTFHGVHKIQAVGKNIKMINATKSIEQKMQDIANIAKNESIQKFVTFYNSEAFGIGATPYRIARLIAPVSEKTTLLATGQIIAYVSTPGTIKITYMLNDNLQTYQPKQICPIEGYYLINILYVLKDVVESAQNIFEVYIESEDGQGSVDVEQCLLSLSGSGLIDAKEWDGTITINDSISAIYLGTINRDTMYTDSASISLKQKMQLNLFDEYSNLDFKIIDSGFQDSCVAELKSKSITEFSESYNSNHFSWGGDLYLTDDIEITTETA